jgi:hypothetical protein
MTKMNPQRRKDYSSVYSAWFRTPVLLFVLRECSVPIPCNIIGESIAAVRICIQPGWEIDVPKEFILAVEEAGTRDLCLN